MISCHTNNIGQGFAANNFTVDNHFFNIVDIHWFVTCCLFLLLPFLNSSIREYIVKKSLRLSWGLQTFHLSTFPYLDLTCHMSSVFSIFHYLYLLSLFSVCPISLSISVSIIYPSQSFSIFYHSSIHSISIIYLFSIPPPLFLFCLFSFSYLLYLSVSF